MPLPAVLVPVRALTSLGGWRVLHLDLLQVVIRSQEVQRPVESQGVQRGGEVESLSFSVVGLINFKAAFEINSCLRLYIGAAKYLEQDSHG